jgi:hypothetical protein
VTANWQFFVSAGHNPPIRCRLPHDCLILFPCGRLTPRRHVHPPLSILSCQPYQLGKYKIINHPGRRPKKNSALTRSLPNSTVTAACLGGGMRLPTEQRRHTQNYLHLQKLGLMTLLFAILRRWFTKDGASKICL